MPPITKRTAWIYGSMSLPIAIISYPLAVWIPRLYSTEIGLNLTVIGMVIFAAAIFDAISDPAMGFMSDRFNTRWGRRKPWILFGVPLYAFAVWMLLNPEVGTSIVYLAFFFILLRLATTVLGAYRLELENLGVVEDTPEAISACLARAAETADVVISSGGVSVGDYDFVRQCVESMGALTDYKVAMKPGKPVCFGHIDRSDKGRALFLGLPGNAVSSFVVLTELYLPALRYLMNGRSVVPNQHISATLKEDLKRRAGRLEFQRGVLSREVNASGQSFWQVSAFGGQDSHRVLGLARANCTIQIPADVAEIPAGTEVTVSVFPWFESLD